MGAESFTILAILEARDKASEIFAKIDESLDKFSDTAERAAEVASAAGDGIDEGLLKTASGADALELASARVEAAQAKQAETAKALADAERDLLAVTRQDTATEEQVAAAASDVAAAQEKAAASAAQLKEARSSLQAAAAAGDENALAAATERVAVAEREAAGAANELAAAQARQSSLNTSENVTAAAQGLTAAEKDATKASNDLTAAQGRQSEVQKAVAASDTEAAAAAAEQAAAQKDAADKAAASAKLLSGAGKIAGITALGLGVAGAVMVKAAGNFQDSTTHLVTDAGESAENLQMVQAGILKVSIATGQSAESITDAMYHIESGGMHAQSGLAVLKVAAEGARVGGADLDDVSKALVGTLNAYGMTSKNAGVQTKMATSLMNQLITTVGSGDMRMQDLATSLSSVAPFAARAGLSFAQVGGALATMTAQGMTAQQASQDLGHTISELENPNAVAIKEMQAFGLSSTVVSNKLGKRGLTGTLAVLTDTITKHMGPAGTVILSTFNNAKAAAANADTEIKAMPSSLQALARQLLAGSISSQQWTNDLKQMSPIQAGMMQQFAETAKKAHSFNSMLTSGSPAAQTYSAALAKMTGGQVSLKTALMLTGPNAEVFQKNVDHIAASAKHAGSNVDNWGRIQSTFNFKMDAAKTGVENTGIAIGSALLPAATSILKVITSIVEPIAEWTAKHRTLTEVIFGSVVAIAATIAIISVAAKTYKMITGTLDMVKKTLQAVGLMAKQTADTQKAAAEEGAAAEETAAEEGSAAAEAGAAESSGSWIASAARTTAAWIASGAKVVAQAAVTAAQSIAKGATVVASNIAGAASSAAAWVSSAASSAAAWVSSAASAIASGAMWVVTSVGQAIAVSASYIAGAVAAAAAWVAANLAMTLGIALIVIAVIAAVVLIVKYWRDIEQAAVAVWHAIVDAAKAAWSGIVAAVKAVRDTIVAVFKAALDLIVDIFEKFTLLGLIIKYHQDILSAIESAWHAVASFVTGIFDDVESTAETIWREIQSVITTVHDAIRTVVQAAWSFVSGLITREVNGIKAILAWFGQLGSLFHGWWDDAVDAVTNRVGALVSFVEGIPGKILRALGNVGTMLWDAGVSIVEGLIHGVESMIGSVGHTMSSIASEIKSFLPFSPAKQGPLSGAGDPGNSGRSIARNLAAGMVAGKGLVTSAARQLAGAVGGPGGLTAAGGGLSAVSAAGGAAGGITIHVHAEGAQVMSDRDMDQFVQKIGRAVATKIAPQAGLRFRMS